MATPLKSSSAIQEIPNSLDGIVVRALFKDREGALWVACDQSLNKFDEKTETFTHYPIPLAIHITQDTAGLLWVATHGGLYRLDPASGRIQRYSHDPNDPSSLSSSDLSYCGEDKEGRFWVASNGGLDEFDRRAGKVIRRNILPSVPAELFYEDRFGTFWIFHSSPNPLAVFDRKSNTLTRYAFPERDPTITRVSAMLENRDGELLLATHGLGLLKLDRERRQFIRYGNIANDPQSLPQDKLDALFTDREGNIWVAPGRMAPAFLTTKPPPFKKLPKVPGSSIEPFVAALYQDRKGILWIGTPEALIRYDSVSERITPYRTGGPGVGTDASRFVKTAQVISGLALTAMGCTVSIGERRNSRPIGTIRRIRIASVTILLCICSLTITGRFGPEPVPVWIGSTRGLNASPHINSNHRAAYSFWN
jgi:ligand-binding sensor domain-containing protein